MAGTPSLTLPLAGGGNCAGVGSFSSPLERGEAGWGVDERPGRRRPYSAALSISWGFTGAAAARSSASSSLSRSAIIIAWLRPAW